MATSDLIISYNMNDFVLNYNVFLCDQRTVAVIVALNSLLLVVPWHTNIPQGENLPEYTHHLQSGAVAFVIIFAFEVSV